MFYVFHQNNNYGKYLLPAREVAIEADTHDEALGIYGALPGVYFSNKSDKECHCCNPRWSKTGYDYSPEEFMEYMEDSKRLYKETLSPKVPHLMVKRKDGTDDFILAGTPVQASNVPVDAPVPMPVEESAQECAAPIEDEVKNDLVVPVDSNT